MKVDLYDHMGHEDSIKHIKVTKLCSHIALITSVYSLLPLPPNYLIYYVLTKVVKILFF